MEFKDKLKKLRTERGISQQTLADAIYVSRSARWMERHILYNAIRFL